MEVSKLCLFLFSFVFVRFNCDEDVIYVPRITDNVVDCADFTNEMMDCTGLVLGSTKGDEGEEFAKLGGSIAILNEITSDYDIEIDIWKVLDIADEFMYSTRANFCSSLQNSDAPWYPVIDTLNITECPVAIKTYEIAELTVSLDCVKDVMCHDFCGEYRAHISLVNKSDKVSCHAMEFSIVEENAKK